MKEISKIDHNKSPKNITIDAILTTAKKICVDKGDGTRPTTEHLCYALTEYVAELVVASGRIAHQLQNMSADFEALRRSIANDNKQKINEVE